jgi:hypothetical protein
MHRTLKDETTIPPALNLVAQQQLFDRFKDSYNRDRPHEALDGAVPDDLYERSVRRLPKKLPPFDYPHSCEVRRVSKYGLVHIRAVPVRLGTVFAGEEVGFRWLTSRRWEILCGAATLGILDLLTNRVVGPKRKPGRKRVRENMW